jgi:hypothetical protein
MQTFLQDLTPTDSTDYSLWKVTKKIKQITKSSPPQGTWARNNAKKAQAFATHLKQVFEPHPLENTTEEEYIIQLLETRYQLEPPMKGLKRAEVQEIINSLNPPKKVTGVRLHHQQNSQRTAHYWNTISYTAVQCSVAQRVLPSTMESRSDYHHTKAWEPPPLTS